MRRVWGFLVSILLTALIVAPLPAAAIDSEPGPGCSVDWTAAKKSLGAGFLGHITDARAGRQDCYDRFVVDVSGAAGGYFVQYVDTVRSAGSGFPIPLRGGARLLVVVRAPAHDPLFNPTYEPADRSEAVDVTGFETFRQVAYDASFEGETQFGIGVRERLPFRVLVLTGPGAGSRLVVDVAHDWTGSPGPRTPSPLGNLESARGSALIENGVVVKGWVLDPDTPDPTYAWVTVDGVGQHLFADANRPDVGAAFPGYGPRHGFLGKVLASPGPHTVCVTASNTGPGVHTPLGCRAVVVPDGSPIGNFERATGVVGGIEVKGWMLDPSIPGARIYAWVTVDGVGRHLHASGNRPDVGAAFPAPAQEPNGGAGPDHGFLGTLPASPGTHRVCVTAANIGPGSHASLGCRDVVVPNPSPFGNVESARGVFGEGIEIKGWMADPSDPTRSIFGWVTIDGSGQHVLANQNRPDVGAAFPGFGANHGFRNTLAAGPGRHQVCVTASNVGPGNHTSLGCRVVGVFEQPAVWPAAHVVFGTPEAAAADFMTRALGVPAQLGAFRQGDARSGEIDVLFTAGGPPSVNATLAMRRLGPQGGWFALAGSSGGVMIDAPVALAQVPAGPLTVEGTGRGFEALIVVEAFLAGSTTPLDQQATTGGAFETPEPFSVTLDLSGARPGDVVSILARGGVGHPDDSGELSAIPVVIGP